MTINSIENNRIGEGAEPLPEVARWYMIHETKYPVSSFRWGRRFSDSIRFSVVSIGEHCEMFFPGRACVFVLLPSFFTNYEQEKRNTADKEMFVLR
jgi:hypothetical protein